MIENNKLQEQMLPLIQAFKILQDDYINDSAQQYIDKLEKIIEKINVNNLENELQNEKFNKLLDVIAHIIAVYPVQNSLNLARILYKKSPTLLQLVFNRGQQGILLNYNFKKLLEDKASLINLNYFFANAFNPNRVQRITKTITNILNKKNEKF